MATNLTLADVLSALTGLHADTATEYQISAVTIDSRRCEPGALFVALPGENTDGHNFVAQAFAAGAIAAITDRPVDADCTVISAENPQLPADRHPPFCIRVENSLRGLQKLATAWRNRFSPQVIGITGSVGKTSTKELTALVLAQKFTVLKNQGNLNNEIGLPLTLLQLTDAHQQVVLEMGMYDVGEIETLCRIARPQVGVVTNVGPSHLARLGSLERIAAAKQELVASLPADGVAILNMDDPLVMKMAAHTRARVFTYGLSPDADLWADQINSEGLEGVRFVLHHRDETIHVKVPLLGRHSVHTALRAAAVGLSQGMHWGEIIAGLQNKNAQLRLVAIPGPHGSIILDDTYNASPESTIAALNLLHELTAPRKIAVLGYMAELGSYEEEGHRKVGCRAADTVDVLIAVGRRAETVAAEAVACGLDAANVHVMPSTQTALDFLRKITAAGDTILVKGSRSMAMETIVDGLTAAAGSED